MGTGNGAPNKVQDDLKTAIVVALLYVESVIAYNKCHLID